jgi:hypothetical protein
LHARVGESFAIETVLKNEDAKVVDVPAKVSNSIPTNMLKLEEVLL